MKKTTLVIAVSLLLLLGFGHLYYAVTGDYHRADLMESVPRSGNASLSQEELSRVEKIFSQRFNYLGHGHQTYAFVSDDGKYVLKLFKKDYLSRTWLVHVIPPIGPFRPLFLHQGDSKEARTKKLLKGYQDAFSHSRENSGLLYYHRYRDDGNFGDVAIVDGLGFWHRLPLQEYTFALQEKAAVTRDVLSSHLSKGDVEGAKKRVRRLFELFLSDYRRGVYDNDHNLFDNTGFVEERAIRLDVGKVVWDPDGIDEAFIQKDLEKIVFERMHPWFKRQYPQYAPEILKDMQDPCCSLKS